MTSPIWRDERTDMRRNTWSPPYVSNSETKRVSSWITRIARRTGRWTHKDVASPVWPPLYADRHGQPYTRPTLKPRGSRDTSCGETDRHNQYGQSYTRSTPKPSGSQGESCERTDRNYQIYIASHGQICMASHICRQTWPALYGHPHIRTDMANPVWPPLYADRLVNPVWPPLFADRHSHPFLATPICRETRATLHGHPYMQTWPTLYADRHSKPCMATPFCGQT
jgi:hypothetical protein